jgi:hypothetical protein
MLVIRTKEQLDYNGSSQVGRQIGDCLFVISQKEWESIREDLPSDTQSFEENESIGVDMQKLYHEAEVFQADPATIDFINKHGCNTALRYFREVTRVMKNKDNINNVIDGLTTLVTLMDTIEKKVPNAVTELYYDESHSPKNTYTLDFLRKLREETIPQSYHVVFDRRKKTTEEKPRWKAVLDFMRDRHPYELLNILESDAFLLIRLRGLVFRVTSEIKNDITISVHHTIDYVKDEVKPSAFCKFLESLNDANFEASVHTFFGKLPKLIEPSGIAIKLSEHINECCFYVASRTYDEEDWYDQIEDILTTEQEKADFADICKSYRVYSLEEEEDSPGDPYQITCLTDVLNVEQTITDGIEDYGTCLNPEVLQKLEDDGREYAYIVAFVYYKNR